MTFLRHFEFPGKCHLQELSNIFEDKNADPRKWTQTKGQINSEANYLVLNNSKKRTKTSAHVDREKLWKNWDQEILLLEAGT